MNLPEFFGKTWPAFFARATAFFDRSETSAEADKGSAALASELEKTKASLEAAQKEITELTAAGSSWADKFSALQSKLTALEKERDELKAKEQDIEKRASARALEITASLGIKPIPSIPTGTSESLLEQYNAIDPIKEPAKRTEFYRKHKAALMALRNKETR